MGDNTAGCKTVVVLANGTRESRVNIYMPYPTRANKVLVSAAMQFLLIIK